MIRSSACLSANDLSIRCRVRKSPYTTNPKFDDAIEMTCTMRHWEPEKGNSMRSLPISPQRQTNPHASKSTRQTMSDIVASDPRHMGPELVLTPVEMASPLARDRRDNSPIPIRGSVVQKKPSPRDSATIQHPTTHIPLTDIMVVETMEANNKPKCHKMKLTTHEQGVLEFDNLSLNSREILFAFLKANIAPERLILVDHNAACTDDHSVPSAASTASSYSMDVDKLTQEKILRCSERESFSEKFNRRSSRFANLLSELCSTICDSACCRAKTEDIVTMDGTSTRLADTAMQPGPPLTSPATSTKSINLKKGQLEEEDSILATSSAGNKSQRQKFHVPSGLSIEPNTVSTDSGELKAKLIRQNLKGYNFPSGLSVEPEEASHELEA